jgi:cell division protein FtsN
MARGKGRQAVRNGGPAVPGWALFGGGVVVGAILCAVVVLGGHLPSLRRNDQPRANPDAVAAKGSAPGIADQGSSGQKPTFDFYKVLPEKEVVIPDAQLSQMAKEEQQRAAEANNPNPAQTSATGTASAGGNYVLQLGAFPNASDAEAMKARLALQGFTANVQSVTLDGQVWNRVRIGPFASATELQAVQKRLADAGFKAMPLKER